AGRPEFPRRTTPFLVPVRVPAQDHTGQTAGRDRIETLRCIGEWSVPCGQVQVTPRSLAENFVPTRRYARLRAEQDTVCQRAPRRSPRLSSSGPRVCRPCANRAAVRALAGSEVTSWWNRRASARIASAPGRVSSLSTRLADRTASAGNDAMRRASRATNAARAASGRARLVQPYRSATSAPKSSPPRNPSMAPPRPSGRPSPRQATATRTHRTSQAPQTCGQANRTVRHRGSCWWGARRTSRRPLAARSAAADTQVSNFAGWRAAHEPPVWAAVPVGWLARADGSELSFFV